MSSGWPLTLPEARRDVKGGLGSVPVPVFTGVGARKSVVADSDFARCVQGCGVDGAHSAGRSFVILVEVVAEDGHARCRRRSTVTRGNRFRSHRSLCQFVADCGHFCSFGDAPVSVACGSRLLEESLRGAQMGLLAESIDVDTALTLFTERVNAWQRIGDDYTASGVSELASMLARLGYHDGAARLYGATNRATDPETAAALWTVTRVGRDMIGRDAFNNAYEAGRGLSPQAAGEFAHQLIAQARAEHTTTS